jgi:putative transposase
MFPRRPGRILGFDYVGYHRYSLTTCTRHRKPFFTDPSLVESILANIRQCCDVNQFALFAYCFMPDHLHLLVEGRAENSDLQQFMSRWKQSTGFSHKKRTGEFLWQESYFDHVLRDDEETWRAARYILENPVRKCLVANFQEYPFSGSDVFSPQQLQDLWLIQRQG